MHFRTAVRREIVGRLARARSDLAVRGGGSYPFGEDSFRNADGGNVVQVQVQTTELRPVAPEGLILMGECIGAGASIPVDLLVEVQIYVQMPHGDSRADADPDAEDTVDEIEADLWPVLAVIPLTTPAARGLVLEFEGEITQRGEPTSELAQMVRVLRFAVAGEFDPADVSTLHKRG